MPCIQFSICLDTFGFKEQKTKFKNGLNPDEIHYVPKITFRNRVSLGQPTWLRWLSVRLLDLGCGLDLTVRSSRPMVGSVLGEKPT